MNKDFKVGDVVVINLDTNARFSFRNILGEEKYLFEITKVLETHIFVKSLTVDSVDRIQFLYDEIRHATLKEQYLRSGNIVQLANGDVCLVLKERLVDRTGFVNIEIYNDDSKAISYSDVIKVYEYESQVFGSINSILEIGPMHKLIWERKPKIKLTDDEVVILKNVDNKYKYIARDKDNDNLSVYTDKPITSVREDFYCVGKGSFQYFKMYNHLFQDITFESGSHLIADLIKENEK